MSVLLVTVILVLAGYIGFTAIRRGAAGTTFDRSRLLLAGAVLAVLFLVVTTTVEIPGSETGVVTNLGQITDRTLPPGLNFKLPWENVIVVNTSVRALTQEKSDAFTSDKQHAYTDYAVNFAIRPATAPEVLRNYQGEIDTRIIEPRVEFWLKDIEPRYSAADLIAKRVEVANAVQQHLENDLKDKGVDIQAVLITNISFGDQYQKASEALAAAQQDLQHERIELQIREVQAQQVVAAAQGQAKANALIRGSLPQNPQEADALVRMRMIELLDKKWNGTMPQALGAGSLLSIGATEAAPK